MWKQLKQLFWAFSASNRSNTRIILQVQIVNLKVGRVGNSKSEEWNFPGSCQEFSFELGYDVYFDLEHCFTSFPENIDFTEKIWKLQFTVLLR